MFEYEWDEEFPDIPEDVLTKNQRDVVYLRYVSGLRFVEISAEVERPKDAVIRTHKQALKRIEKHLTTAKLLQRPESPAK